MARLAMPSSPRNEDRYKITPSKQNLYKTVRTNITPHKPAPSNVSNADDYKAARAAIAAKVKSAPSKSAAPATIADFTGDGAGGFGGGSAGSYLDIFKAGGAQDDKTLADYMAEANKIYKPSLDYLAQQKTDATNRAGQYDKSLQDMYAALVGSINAQQPVIAQNYNNAINEQNQITNDSKAAVGNNFQTAQAQQMDMLRQLGIEAAAPDTLQSGQDSQAFFQSLLDSSGAGYNSFLNSQKVASQDFNTAQSNIAAQTGTNARADLKMGLQDILGQLAGRGADLQTQINQQAVQMQSGAAQALLEQQKAMLDAAYKQDQMNLDLSKFGLAQQSAFNSDENAKARLALDTAKFEATPPKTAPTPKIPSNPWGNANDVALQLYQGNKTAAANAIKAIQDSIRINFGGDMPMSPGTLLQTVLARVSPTGKATGHGDTSNLQSLVDYLYKQLHA